MPNEYLPWVVSAILALALIATLIVLRRRSRAAKQRAQSQTASHESRVSELVRAHEDDIAALRRGHAQELEQVTQQRAEAEETIEQTRSFIARGMKHEAASHSMIVDACAELGVDGALLTNLVFLPEDTRRERRFVAQIDHLLLLESALIVIESKRWKGLVFDGIRPSEAQPGLRYLIDESDLPESFAFHVNRASKGSSSWNVQRYDGPDAPAFQVRRQAGRLSQHIRTTTGDSFWLETCVLYSHPDAEVHARPQDVSQGGAPTHVVKDIEGLKRVIKGFEMRSKPALTSTQLTGLVDVLGSLGPQVDRFGVYDQHGRRGA
ncbi:nuclease-related domain-containing protein [Microbacterium betulae]|uniref:Nuclease-related domain-containing protein n=1 Tax=Microbacterium betulae TaxID=2981139 RepID=A0AA97FF32_9MICO|nr:nuclease-related domain-containing protein [Microbacterium sp. AB]WOF21453.1 nuclease-related domain-containing protein [Microbacterium sp. AB]